MSPRAKAWVVETSVGHHEIIRCLEENVSLLSKALYGYEVDCERLKVYVCFNERKRRTQVKRFFGRASDYCDMRVAYDRKSVISSITSLGDGYTVIP